MSGRNGRLLLPVFPCVKVPCAASFFKRYAKVLDAILSIRAAARILKPCFIKFLYFFSSLFMAVPLASGTVYLSKFKWVGTKTA